jgi:hypothetical protein
VALQGLLKAVGCGRGAGFVGGLDFHESRSWAVHA